MRASAGAMSVCLCVCGHGMSQLNRMAMLSSRIAFALCRAGFLQHPTVVYHKGAGAQAGDI